MANQEPTSTTRDVTGMGHVQEARGRPFDQSHLPSNLLTALLMARRTHGGAKEILEDHDRIPIRYDDLITAAYALAAELRKTTVAGEVVGVLLPTSVGAVVTFFALLLAGCIPAMLNYGARPPTIRAACALASVKLALTSERFLKEGRLESLPRRWEITARS